MKEKWRDILKKYRFAALVALAGVVLMGGQQRHPGQRRGCAAGQSGADGEPGQRKAGGGGDAAAVSTYQGAVVVCQGAGDSRVRLRVMETVAVLTGLSSDKISVVQWKQ